MLEFNISPVQFIDEPSFNSNGVELFVKRLDMIDDVISGNKAYKLRLNITDMLQAQSSSGVEPVRMASFGGAYSNHIHALAAAGHHLGIKTIGFIRGDDPRGEGRSLPVSSCATSPLTNPSLPSLSPTLEDALSWGMELIFLSRSDYRLRADPHWLAQLQQRYGSFYLIPEGGSNVLGAKGCGQIIQELNTQLDGQFDTVCVACGTGTTLAGMSMVLESHQRILGFPVLKGAKFLENDILALQAEMGGERDNWQLLYDYHGGGYARFDARLVAFMDHLENFSGIKTEPIYTAKVFDAVFRLNKEKWFAKGSRVVVIHTGGLQGLRGMDERINSLRSAVGYKM